MAGVGYRRSFAPLFPLPKQAFFNLREKFVKPLFCTIHFRFVKLNLTLQFDFLTLQSDFRHFEPDVRAFAPSLYLRQPHQPLCVATAECPFPPFRPHLRPQTGMQNRNQIDQTSCTLSPHNLPEQQCVTMEVYPNLKAWCPGQSGQGGCDPKLCKVLGAEEE